MISLICTNCKAELEVDDAFAGGVCRCRHCGAIQTVPAHLKKSGGASDVAPKPGRTLFTRTAKREAASAATATRAAAPVSEPAPANRMEKYRAAWQTLPARQKAYVLSGGGTLLLVLIVAIWLLAR
jgi:hypothetical protein